ncbi:MAG: hypothetical protein CSA26_03105, partial [Desulfobacterales bacterium]
VTREGVFQVSVHCPSYSVTNVRASNFLMELGQGKDGTPINNAANFPDTDVAVTGTKKIYEIRNAFAFRGCTFIDSGWAIRHAHDPSLIRIEKPEHGSLLQTMLDNGVATDQIEAILKQLPRHTLLDIAQNSDDEKELTLVVGNCCELRVDDTGKPVGVAYIERAGKPVPCIHDFELYETLANNPFLPDIYKEVMVLRPGAQGGSEIVGDCQGEDGLIFEYLRGNSYIPWGHYAANFAHNSIRYKVTDLSLNDMQSLRHLYYQRTYLVLAQKLDLSVDFEQRQMSVEEVERLRQAVAATLQNQDCEQCATLWGWNFGYDFSASGYRLHASHQMIHQQYAMVPEKVSTTSGEESLAFSCGDMVADTVDRYAEYYNSDFFTDYLKAIRNNTRVDGEPGEQSLVVWEDKNVMLFVPKAQVSQWELQVMVIADEQGEPIGNIIEAGAEVRASLDKGIYFAQQTLAGLGAQLVTTIEFSKRMGVNNGQRLLYSLLPKLPWSMGAFSEAQSRYICGHYPEDFALACRNSLARILNS